MIARIEFGGPPDLNEDTSRQQVITNIHESVHNIFRLQSHPAPVKNTLDIKQEVYGKTNIPQGVYRAKESGNLCCRQTHVGMEK